jgi:hypothetical protein
LSGRADLKRQIEVGDVIQINVHVRVGITTAGFVFDIEPE